MTPSRPIYVLVAEDDALVNEGTAHQIARLGYSVVGCAYDGPQAIKLATECHPSVVLMDLQMIDPETGREDPLAGLKATRWIQEQHPTAVVMLTAYETPDLVSQACEAGANGYLVKPAGDLELERAIAIARARFRDLLALRRANLSLQLRNQRLQSALDLARPFAEMLTSCANCRRVRDEDEGWQSLERYLDRHAIANFTHGLCPECASALYPDIFPVPPTGVNAG